MSATTPRTSGHERLKAQLSLPGAVLVGLGSMLGTGVFVSLAFAVQHAGDAVLVSLLLAAGIAACNGLSSAQLAAAHPVSGGTYEYAYRLLHPALGFAAGWLFLLAKSASAAAAALGVGAYVGAWMGWPPGASWRLVSMAVVAALTVLAARGLHRTVQANAIMVAITLAGLLAYVAAGWWVGFRAPDAAAADGAANLTAHGVLRAAALLFVAFTGYGRIATMGEEVREPRRTIPRAVVITVVFAAALYAAVATSSLLAVGSVAFGDSFDDQVASLEAVAQARFPGAIASLVAVAALTAMTGVLLGLVLGLSRVVLAMARRGDMPHALCRLNQGRTAAPAATFLVGAVIALLVLGGSVRVAWSFSAFTVLLYYGITNVAALRLPAEGRFVPRGVSALGLAGCLFLAVWMDATTWLLGAAVLAAGAAWFGAAEWGRRRKAAA